MSQAKQIREFLEWLDTCPFKHRISSMQGDTVCFVRFWLEEKEGSTEEEQTPPENWNEMSTSEKKVWVKEYREAQDKLAINKAFLKGVMDTKILEKQ